MKSVHFFGFMNYNLWCKSQKKITRNWKKIAFLIYLFMFRWWMNTKLKEKPLHWFQLIDFVMNMLHGSNHWRMEMRLVMNAWSCRTSNSNTKNSQPHFNGTHHIKKWLLSIFICHGPWAMARSTFYILSTECCACEDGKDLLEKNTIHLNDDSLVVCSCSRVFECSLFSPVDVRHRVYCFHF